MQTALSTSGGYQLWSRHGEPGDPAEPPPPLVVSAGTANSRARPRPQPPPGHRQPPRTTSGYSGNSSRAALCSARPPMGNATPGSAVAITLLAAPFIKAQEKGIKAAHVCLLTKPLGAPPGYGIPVRGSRCPARSGYGRPRSQAPGRRAPLCLPAGRLGSTRVPSRLSATPTPLPHTRRGDNA